MKLVSAALLCALSCFAQSPEPEFYDVFFRLDAGKLVPLERQTSSIQGKASGFIVMNAKGVAVLPGGKSPVRFRSEDALDFIVRSPLAASAADPEALYCLRKLDAKKKQRELVITTLHASAVGASTKRTATTGLLPLTFSRYGNSSYKLSTPPLPPGEYAVGRLYGQLVFCFGVD